MAKKKAEASSAFIKKAPAKRKGIHAKTKTSKSKGSVMYKKANRGQGK